MNFYNTKNTSALPSKCVLQPAGVSHFPPSVEITDQWNNGGSGISNANASHAALGEYFERRHFYMEVFPERSGVLETALSPTEVEKFVRAFRQTADRAIIDKDIRQHTFSLSKAYRCEDFSACYIPSACLSLSAHTIASDSWVYPLRDTCGCCFHSDPILAMLGSLKEQLERQFLAKFWLTKTCSKIVKYEDATELLTKSDVYKLYQSLNVSGDVTILDISDSDFPGTCLLTIYGNKDPTRHVRYCAGMAYAATAKEALSKSILELWQTYRYIDLHGALQRKITDIEDPYLRYFLSCNSYITYQNITTVYSQNHKQRDNLSKFSVNGLLSSLKSLGITGFFYIKPITIETDCYYAAKYISPDLFLHMNNAQNINTDNLYSQYFSHEIHNDRLTMMVPFP
ncbi:YcaO-like family protein [Pseudomonas sp. fls2-241-R2A-110]|uniref:YcaO-like family protein n=1 Tax=Pseudomonas sp. fls2-241-R2A-110 TaxID=3040311 RepID=UPI002555EFE3|nr:YcaO-like family protein [Pseudomonas sp. fls2-241-R2A-110]